MKSPSGWIEPGQSPEFNEYTIVLKGMLRVTTNDEIIDIEVIQPESFKDQMLQYAKDFTTLPDNN